MKEEIIKRLEGIKTTLSSLQSTVEELETDVRMEWEEADNDDYEEWLSTVTDVLGDLADALCSTENDLTEEIELGEGE